VRTAAPTRATSPAASSGSAWDVEESE
jgi:hypothetical protein